jgi:alkylhydroperoxidase/carboxymuconolactone decarboxylase family protein YurZ
MSEKESDQPEPRAAPPDLLKLLERIRANAFARVTNVEESDSRALEADANLASVGETWLRQEILHTKHLHWIRIGVLLALLFVAGLWLLSVGALLVMVGFKIKDFELSDVVLVTYMGTTTASVLGLFHIAAKWLFSAGFVDFARSIKDLLTRELPKN